MRKIKNGQVILEFTFCMIIIFLMIFAIFRIFKWTGVDLAERRISHDNLLQSCGPSTGNACENYTSDKNSPLGQIDPFFHQPTGLNAIWTGQ